MQIDAKQRELYGTLRGAALPVPADPHRLTKEVRANLDMLARTVADVRDFVSPSPSARNRESLAQVVTEAVEMARDNARKCGFQAHLIDMHLDVPGWIVLPLARHLIVVALANVIKNAYESFAASPGQPGEGQIVVRADLVGQAVQITVADNGFGMTDEQLALASGFTPGHRNKQKRFSTGFGLPIADRNVTAHGGTIALGRPESGGTVVTITLPLDKCQEVKR